MKSKSLVFLIMLLIQSIESSGLLSEVKITKKQQSSELQNKHNIPERLLAKRLLWGRRRFCGRQRRQGSWRGGRGRSRIRGKRGFFESGGNRGHGGNRGNRGHGGYGGHRGRAHQVVHNHYYVTNNHTHLQGKFHKTQVVVVAGSKNVNAANLKKT